MVINNNNNDKKNGLNVKKGFIYFVILRVYMYNKKQNNS